MRRLSDKLVRCGGKWQSVKSNGGPLIPTLNIVLKRVTLVCPIAQYDTLAPSGQPRKQETFSVKLNDESEVGRC